MKKKLQQISIIYRRTMLLVSVPLLITYVVLPLVVAMNTFNVSIQQQILTFAMQSLIPVSSLLWAMAYLQIWVEDDGREAMQACQGGKYSCAYEIVMIALGFALMLIPATYFASCVFDSMWMEYARLTLQIGLFLSSFYLLAIVFNSVTMSSMLLMSYNFFCVFFSGDSTIHRYCIIRPHIMACDDTFVSLYLVEISIICLLLFVANCIEKRRYCSNVT